jgi:hypothetical protein
MLDKTAPFLAMGFLDAISAAMQVLATIYLPGTLLVLLPQVAIPLSMLASRLAVGVLTRSETLELATKLASSHGVFVYAK